MTRIAATATGAALLSSLTCAAPAQAACTVPNVITNGQVADATKVMEDFNAVAACTDGAVKPSGSPQAGAIAVVSGPKTITSGNLSGDVTTAGSTVTTLAPSGVTAGTYVSPTITIDQKGRITGASNGGSGGSLPIDYFNGLTLPAPLASNFTVSANSNFGSNYGLQAAGVGVSLYGQNTTFTFAWADRPVAGGGTTGDFSVTGLIKLAGLNKGNHAIGITLGNGTKRLTWGFRNTQLWMSHTSGTATSDGYWTYGGDIGAISSPTLFRIRKTGATIYFEIALDGKNFDVITSEAATAYLPANVTTFGIGILPNNSFQRIVCYGLLGG